MLPAVRPEPLTVDAANYGGLKAMCELAARDLFGDTTLVIRPSMVVGPHDYTDRLGYWLRRVVAGGQVLAPGPPEARLQLLDARDLASWLLQLVRAEATGTYNAAGRARLLVLRGPARHSGQGLVDPSGAGVARHRVPRGRWRDA